MASSRSSTTTARRSRAFLASLVTLVLLLPASSQGLGEAQVQVQVPELHEAQDDGFDSRTAVVEPTAAQRAAAAALGAEVRWNHFGTPVSMISHGGLLAEGIRGDDAGSAALGWVEENDALLGVDATSLELHADVALRGSAGRVVIFRQRIDGLLVSPDGFLSVGLVGSSDEGWSVAYASSTLVGDDTVAGDPELTAAEALVEAAEDVGADVSTADVDRDGRRAGWTAFEVEGLDDAPQLVRPVAFPTPRRGVLRAFETVVSPDFDEGYRHIVDAETGAVLFRESTVDHMDPDDPEWQLFPSFPPQTPINRHPWNYPSADTRELWCWDGLAGCKRAASDGSPHPETPWDVNAVTGTPTFTTTGNYAHSQENWFDFLFPGPTGYQPTSATREYTFPWNNVWFEEQCNPDVFVVGSGNDIDAATVNLFAGHNRMHNWAYHLGFTEHTWNAQQHNFGVGTAEGDPLIGMVQAGAVSHGPPIYAGRDNAFMRTLPDGTSPQSAMFLWQPIPGAFYAPCVDGDYDMAVIAHEYGHLIENRMIGKGVRRTGFHAGAMGESVSDLMAMEILNAYNLVGGGPSAYAIGTYVTGNTVEAIRNYNMSFQSAGRFPQPGSTPRINPLNLSAVGYDIVGPQVHATGEIWSALNFDIRSLFLSRYPGGAAAQRECADGQRPVSQCPGSRRWIQLMFDSFLLMPTAPTFLDARDAILAADVMRFGGANQDLLWLAFARRGFGQDASVTGTEEDPPTQDTMPVPSWESPLHEEATLDFSAVAKDEGNAPIANFQVYVGHYEARVRPIDAVEAFVPRAPEGYDFVAHAPGYGHVRFNVRNLRPGETRDVTIRFPTNWASQSKGAVASGDGADHANLIDDTEGTNWGSTGAPVQGRQVVVELDGVRGFERAKASAMLVPGQNRFVALRQFELYACTVGGPRNPTCDGSTDAGWRRILRSHRDAFPAVNPRPTAPELNLRAFNVPPTTATHVKLVVLENQCTGQSSFQGKQDRDPRHETDCRIGTPLPERDTEVRAAELQLLSSRPEVIGAQLAE